MKRSDINKCKRVGNHIPNIIKDCTGSQTQQYDCGEGDLGCTPVVAGAYSTLDDCIASGCNFIPSSSTDGKMLLHMQAFATKMSMNPTVPFIDKWTDSSVLAKQFTAGPTGGLGTANHPSWNSGDGGWVMFDGGDYMQTVTNTQLTSSGGWTISFSITMDDWALTNVVLGDDSSNNGLIKFISDTQIHMKLYNPGLGTATTKGVTIDTPSALTNGSKYVFTFRMATTGEVSLWISGTLQTNTFSFPTGYDFVSLDEIGAKNGGSLGMTGAIKEILVYEDILTDVQISALNSYMEAQL